MELGIEPGDICNREGCKGELTEMMNPLGGCSCHLFPPCSYCTFEGVECDECGWEHGESK